MPAYFAENLVNFTLKNAENKVCLQKCCKDIHIIPWTF